MARRSKVLSYGMPAVAAVLLGWAVYRISADMPKVRAEEPPRPPSTAPNRHAGDTTVPYIGAIGITEPPGEPIAIAAHVGGIVDKVAVQVGDAVSEGDLLFSVDSRVLAREVELRQQDLDVATAELNSLLGQVDVRKAQNAAASAGIGSAKAAEAVALADLADKKNQLKIAESVDDPRAISKEEIDRRRYALQQAEGRVSEARAGIRQAEALARESSASLALLASDEAAEGPDIAAARQRMDQAAAAVEVARARLELMSVRAPIDGNVLQVNIRPGEFAPANTTSEGMVVLGRAGAMNVRVQIDEVDIPRFRQDQKVWATPRGNAAIRVPLQYRYTEPLVVPKRNLSGRTTELVDTRVMEVVFEAADETQPLAVGQQLEVYIETNEPPMTPAAPAAESAA